MPYRLWITCGITPGDPDLWGFCGGADGVPVACLPAPRPRSTARLRAQHSSHRVCMTWLASPEAKPRRSPTLSLSSSATVNRTPCTERPVLAHVDTARCVLNAAEADIQPKHGDV